jgi:hypothetical protein
MGIVHPSVVRALSLIEIRSSLIILMRCFVSVILSSELAIIALTSTMAARDCAIIAVSDKAVVISSTMTRLTIYARASSDSPRVNAFCRVAPSVRFRAWAILDAGVLLRAKDFKVRT